MPQTVSTSAVQELTDARPEGARFGQSTTDLIAFYGGTPKAQPSGASQAAVTVTAATALATTAATATSPYGFTTSTQADAIVARVNQLVVDVGNINTLLTEIRTVLVTDHALMAGA